jgi:hypothetical protein
MVGNEFLLGDVVPDINVDKLFTWREVLVELKPRAEILRGDVTLDPHLYRATIYGNNVVMRYYGCYGRIDNSRLSYPLA